MAKQIILVTGGARSGKSKHAELRAEELGGRRLYVATAEAKDEEMAQRIAKHKNGAATIGPPSRSRWNCPRRCWRSAAERLRAGDCVTIG